MEAALSPDAMAVAFEMAQQLVAAGQEVGRLLILDSRVENFAGDPANARIRGPDAYYDGTRRKIGRGAAQLPAARTSQS